MTTDRPDHGGLPDGEPPDGGPGDRTDGELLAAYLDDDLDDLDVRRLERRLLDDADLRRQLDVLHETVVALQRPDATVPPDGLTDGIRRRVASAPAPEAPTPSRAPSPPWWRRPVAAVAAVGLLGVVAVSALGIGALTGPATEQEVAAMDADGAEAEAEAAGPQDPPGGEAQAGDAQAGTADGPDAGTDSDGAREEAASAPLLRASPAGIVRVPMLDDPARRRSYLVGLADAPARAALRAASAEEVAAVAGGQRDTLRRQAQLEDSCIDTLIGDDGPAAVRLVASTIDGREAVGAVLPTAGGGLRLVLVRADGACTVAVDEVLPPGALGG